jgi:glycosyltransferase involved in cell wall biosynthesis
MAAIKGPHVVLDALVRLGEAARAIAFTLYGAVEPHTRYARELGAMIDRAGGVATLAGTFPHDRIGEVVSGSHLLVLPSLWYESTPLVLCAALAAGTPALVSRLGGMTELVEDGVNGMSFPAGDAQALSMLLRRLLENPGLVAGLRRTTVARRRFTAAYVDDLEAAFLEVRQEASRAR